MTATTTSWAPVGELPSDYRELTTGELDALHLAWGEQKAILEESGALDEFDHRLQREWSIETGLLCGVYNLDRGTTNVLIEKGIDAALIPHRPGNPDPELVAQVVQDHQDVLEVLFACAHEDWVPSSEHIRELHAALLRHQHFVSVHSSSGEVFDKKLNKGRYKKFPNNPTRPDGSIHEYCPPDLVPTEMERMLEFHGRHQEARIPPEVQAAWLHHAFARIHPFPDGNGRVARALATLVFLQAGWFPLVIRQDDRSGYIDALEAADRGNLKPLVNLFIHIQRRAVLDAIELASQVRAPRSIGEAVASVRAHLVAKGQIAPAEWFRVKDVGQNLLNACLNRLSAVATRLRDDIGSLRPAFQFRVVSGSSPDFTAPEAVAAQLGYVASLEEHNQWAQLTLQTEQTARLVLSFHGLGSHFHGLLAVSAFLQVEGGDPIPVCDDFFQVNYRETRARAEHRFLPWLDRAILNGLAHWRQQL